MWVWPSPPHTFISHSDFVHMLEYEWTLLHCIVYFAIGPVFFSSRNGKVIYSKMTRIWYYRRKSLLNCTFSSCIYSLSQLTMSPSTPSLGFPYFNKDEIRNIIWGLRLTLLNYLLLFDCSSFFSLLICIVFLLFLCA